jgi:hypothetical protein
MMLTMLKSVRAVHALLTLGVLIARPAPVTAECIRAWSGLPDARQKADVVFAGTVTNLKPDPDGVFVTFDVNRVWKGSLPKHVVLPLWTALIETFQFQPGSTYLVFAQRHRSSPDAPMSMRVPTVTEPVFEVSQCSATRLLTYREPALRELGRGAKPR